MKVKLMGKSINLLIGMDAEFFVKNKDGRFIAAARVIPGLKEAPDKLEHGVCHPDGLSLEVGAPPAETPEGMIENLFKVLQEVQDKYLTPAGCYLAHSYKVQHPNVQGVQPEDLAFGCGIEYSALHTQDMVRQRTINTTDVARYSGFHIHLGYTEQQEDNYFTFLDTTRLVRALDKLFLEQGLGTGGDRAVQYGGEGAFRTKPYGCEYRMMDCTVITDKDKLVRLLHCLNKLPEIFGSFK